MCIRDSHVGAHLGGHQHGVPIQISINLGNTFLRISSIRVVAWILARVFAYLPSFFSQILDLIYWTVLIFLFWSSLNGVTLKICTITKNRFCHLGPVHTYPDIFESATFSFRIRKYPRPHVTWSLRIHIEFARPHVFGFTPDSLRIDKIVPPRTGSSRFNPESLRTLMLSYSFKLFLPAVLSGK